MKKMFGLIVVCISLSAVAFAEDKKDVQNTPAAQITAPDKACDLNALNAEKQKLVDQKKDKHGKFYLKKLHSLKFG